MHIGGQSVVGRVPGVVRSKSREKQEASYQLATMDIIADYMEYVKFRQYLRTRRVVRHRLQ